MNLVVTEKNIAAQKLAEILAEGKPKADKVYSTPVYRFRRAGEDWVTIGLKGHILGVGFPDRLTYRKGKGWVGVDRDGVIIPASIPASLDKPPFKARRPFTADGVELSQWSIPSLPYLVYAPLIKSPDEKEIIRSLKNLAAKSESIVIATDFDREGELIGSDARNIITTVAEGVPVSRARYSALTKEEITHAFANLVDIDQALADAGESRQFIDLIWGAVLTRYLTTVKRTGMNDVRSAGRVQTPTLALIADREKERIAFVPEDYWVIKGDFSRGSDEFTAAYEKDQIKNEAEAMGVMSRLEGVDSGRILNVEKKTRRRPAPVPFNTTSLQAAAASEGLAPGRTMRIAETLYMNGLISYPRVDNTVYPPSLDLAGTVKMLTGNPAYAPYANALLSKGKLTATRGKQETTDHPPIHPTGVGDPGKLKGEEWKLYNLIARRFMATLSGPAVIEGTKVTIDVNGETFILKGDVVVQPGYQAIYPYGSNKDVEIPALEPGEAVIFRGARIDKKQTEPPARYSQGKLIQEMEKANLGTKSTRSSIIDRLYEVHYVVNDPLEPTALGMAVIEALERFAPHITSPGMTSELESEMDGIVAGKTSQTDVVSHSRDLLAEVVGELIPNREQLRDVIADAANADARVGTCPKCGGDLLLKTAARKSGRGNQHFVGCSNWPDCDVTYPIPDGKYEAIEEPCPVCGTPQIKVTAFRARKAQTHCLNPDCSTNQEPEVFIGKCAACEKMGKEGKLIAHRNPRTMKRYARCTNYEECNTSYPLPREGELTWEGEYCETCGAPIVVIKTRRGPWHLCINMSCPSKEKPAEDTEGGKPARGGSSKGGKAASTRKTTAKKTSTRAGSTAKRTSSTSRKSTTSKASGSKTTDGASSEDI